MASSIEQKNLAVFFRQYVPSGLPEFGVHFSLEELPLPGSPPEGSVKAQVKAISVDPYLRSRMKDIKSYFPGFSIDNPGDSGILIEVLESNLAQYPVGSLFAGFGKWVTFQIFTEEQLKAFWPVIPGISVTASLGVLGMPGATAYFGYFDLCLPKEGETLVVSGAAGAVGSIVVQLGKIRGCRVIGIAGTDDKLAYLKSIGCDEALNYHNPDLQAAIAQAAPSGVDQYFDNTGGEIKDAVFANLNSFARVSSCGAIASYNLEDAPLGKTWEWAIITKQIRNEGFLCFRWAPKWPEAFAEMSGWIKEGKIKFEETKEHGIENVITAFNKMMTGGNTGKMVVIL